ncbi:MAG TPA: LuxR C-terminal-related transcriptional regulator [Salinimicrobium sp.]|nr:LuxR C-terminal-related transcriptional regulator [Salinimicrobium sp.]
MNIKIKPTNPNPQHLIAGIDLKNSNDIEFIGVRETKTVLILQGGHVKPFKELDKGNYQTIKELFLLDEPAQEYFRCFEENIKIPFSRKIELYSYYMWGGLDHKPDIMEGTLQPSENFRDQLDCPSIDFAHKQFTIDGVELTKRDLIIIDMSANEDLDYSIADRLNIKPVTLDSHKTKLLKKTNCGSKLGLVSKSYREHLIFT